ncbi:MAG TPA: hypothetical protein VKW04_22985 [Planctomycetota bacterium]|nr:hypothetical protein [Planctomycetota bacterium]
MGITVVMLAGIVGTGILVRRLRRLRAGNGAAPAPQICFDLRFLRPPRPIPTWRRKNGRRWVQS